MRYLITGNGGGKTTSSLGVVMRSLAHNKKVLMIQFLKWKRDTGEMLFNHPNFEIYQFGRNGWHGFNSLNEEDMNICKNAVKFIIGKTIVNKYDTIILDEINLVAYLNLLSITEIKELLDYIPEEVNVVLTGRHAPKELIALVDVANQINEVKTPKKFVCVEGVQY
jgi:cob(I)alamin adenosyltransferase